jgi:excinuclease ABC subunit A
VLGRLVDAGNTVVVIEHQLDVIKTADHVIDLGPEGGDWGGRLVAEGTPEEVAWAKGSFTGEALRGELAGAGAMRVRPTGRRTGVRPVQTERRSALGPASKGARGARSR